MSGRRQKLLRRSSGVAKDVTLDRNIRIRKLMESPVIPGKDVVEYLLSRFTGKTGYHYISVSKYGSLFIQDNYKALVPIILHREFPTTTTLGRFHDPNKKDCAISLVRVDPTFKGIIVDRQGNLYSAGIKEIISPAAYAAYTCALGRVSAAEYNAAIQSQEHEYEMMIKNFTDGINERIKHFEELEANAYDDPYDDIVNPYETETPL